MSIFLCSMGDYITTNGENIDKNKQIIDLHIAKTHNA